MDGSFYKGDFEKGIKNGKGIFFQKLKIKDKN